VRCASAGLALAGLVALGLSAATAGNALAADAAPPPTSLATAAVRSPIAADAFYFLMTDRYRDGDPSNNTGGIAGDYRKNGYLPVSDGYYHGGDLAGLTGRCDVSDPADDGLARIKRLGFTSVWITPPFVNRPVQGDSASYHGYWFLDLSRPDPHLGTPQEFTAFMACAKKLGIKVFLDVVVNHTADVISFRDGYYGYIPIETKPYRTAAGKPFNPWTFTSGTTFPALNPRRSFAHVPFVQPGFAGAKAPAVLNQVTRYHNRGDIDWDSCSGRCEMDGDFVGLDDLMTEDWTVVQALAQAYGSWITEYGIDGFRIDTAKHVDPYFFGRWLPLINATAVNAGKPAFASFGEVWLDNPIQLAEQMLDRQLPAVLDFPYQKSVRGFVSGRTTGGALALFFDSDDYYTSAATNAYGLTTFLGNHDMGRIGFFLTSDTKDEGPALLARSLLAHDMLLLTRGVPVVYYGDEVGMTGSGDGRDKQARQDMFPTEVYQWQGQERIGGQPIGKGSSFDESTAIEARIRTLNTLRAEYPALATGAQITRYGQGPVFAISRIDAADRREYLVAFNSGDTPSTVTIPTATPNSTWQPLLGGSSATSDASGVVALQLEPRSSLALRAASALPIPSAPTVTIEIEDDPASGAYLATATVPGSDPASVTFVWRPVGAVSWAVLGTDDARPFRITLDPDRLGRGNRIEVAAIATGSTGLRAASTPVPITMKPLF